MKKKRVMVVDALNQFLRVFITDPSLSTNGEPIGGVKGFFKVLQKLNREIKADQIVVVWDGSGGSKKRKSLHKEYKAGRKPIKLNRNIQLSEQEEKDNKYWQLNRVIEYLNLTPIIQVVEDGVEADDIISVITKMPKYDGWIKVIVSSDKDFFQLCDNETILFRPTQSEVLNKNKIVEKFGIHPVNFALARSIVGDSSDNLPGIKGIGLPTVAKRLPFLQEEKEYEVSDVIEFCKNVKNKTKFHELLINNEELVNFNLQMMQLSAPNLSFAAKQRIDYVFDNSVFAFNQTEFIKNAIQDGFGHLNFDEIFATFKRMCIESKKIVEGANE